MIDVVIYHYFQKADLKEVKFIIGLGDNFYYEGVKSVEDPRFCSTFERVYTSPALKAATWYMIAGNHDHLFNVSAQIAYTNISPRWHFPDFFYTKGKMFKIIITIIFQKKNLIRYRKNWAEIPMEIWRLPFIGTPVYDENYPNWNFWGASR